MLNLSQQTLNEQVLSVRKALRNKIKTLLLRRQKEVAEEIESLDKQDPLLMPSVAESSEPGTDSLQADVHARLTAVKSNLADLYRKIQRALLRIKQGTYEKCESCGKQIEDERLKAMPTATLCLVCSQKSNPKR